MTTSVLFIHGTRTSSAIWEEQQRAMQELGYHTYAIDLPGHGVHQHEKFTLERSFEMITAQVNRIGAPVVLVGLSLGGYIALAYAAQHPKHVQAVLGAGCSTETARFATRAYKRITQTAITLGRKWGPLARKHNRVPDKPTWDVVIQMLGEVSSTSSLDNLKALQMPVWMVSGQWCPLRIGQLSTKRARPDAQHIVVPRAGHDVNSHAPAAFNAIMEKMLTALPSYA